jgi:hypothetical protein
MSSQMPSPEQMPPLTKEEREEFTSAAQNIVGLGAPTFSRGLIADSETILRYEATLLALEEKTNG